MGRGGREGIPGVQGAEWRRAGCVQEVGCSPCMRETCGRQRLEVAFAFFPSCPSP